MATRINRTGAGVARSGLVLLGCLAVAWGVGAMRLARGQSGLQDLASRIVDGEPYKLETILARLPQIEAVEASPICRASALHSVAVIRLRLVEEVMAAGRRDMIDDALERLHDTLRASLSCSPADPFLWLALFWVENTRNGFSADHFKYLRLSYRLGPNEGWIALKRAHVALALLQALPDDLRERTIGEFVKLVDDQLYAQAAAILTGPGWPVRDLLLARLVSSAQRDREGFARVLKVKGYDVQVPGVVDRERPYR
jgi:hypothetical protein